MKRFPELKSQSTFVSVHGSPVTIPLLLCFTATQGDAEADEAEAANFETDDQHQHQPAKRSRKSARQYQLAVSKSSRGARGHAGLLACAIVEEDGQEGTQDAGGNACSEGQVPEAAAVQQCKPTRRRQTVRL